MDEELRAMGVSRCRCGKLLVMENFCDKCKEEVLDHAYGMNGQCFICGDPCVTISLTCSKAECIAAAAKIDFNTKA